MASSDMAAPIPLSLASEETRNVAIATLAMLQSCIDRGAAASLAASVGGVMTTRASDEMRRQISLHQDSLKVSACTHSHSGHALTGEFTLWNVQPLSHVKIFFGDDLGSYLALGSRFEVRWEELGDVCSPAQAAQAPSSRCPLSELDLPV